jgi:hypothetical protein
MWFKRLHWIADAAFGTIHLLNAVMTDENSSWEYGPKKATGGPFSPHTSNATLAVGLHVDSTNRP